MVVPAQPLGVAVVQHREAERLVQPAARVEGVLGVDRQARRQHVALGFGHLSQAVDGGPGALGVDVVGGHRGHATPVVDAGIQQRAEVVGQVGRGLQVDLGRKDQPCQRDRLQEVLRWAGLGLVHGRSRLRQEVLDDHLLHVPVATVGRGDGLQGLDPILPGLADADEDPRGEGDGQLAGRLQGGQATLGLLVRRALVGGHRGQRLHHHPLGWGDGPQRRQLVAEEGAGVGVGEQAGLVQHQAAHGDQVVDGRRIAVLVQPLAGGRVAVLGPLAQREQRFVAAGGRSGPGDGHDLVRRQVGRFDPGGGRGERAVPASVAAQPGEGDEDLGRIRHPAPVGQVPHRRGLGQEVLQGALQQLVRRHAREPYRSLHAGPRYRAREQTGVRRTGLRGR